MLSHFDTLKEVVLRHSKSKVWNEAVTEWEIVRYKVDSEMLSSCVCGQKGLKYLYKIANRVTGDSLFPIGSCCIKKFGCAEMVRYVQVIEERIRLWYKVEDDGFLDLKDLSRRCLAGLWEDGVFLPNRYNGNNGWNDYDFLLRMFNKRSDMTSRQKSKVDAILLNEVKPFLERTVGRADIDWADC